MSFSCRIGGFREAPRTVAAICAVLGVFGTAVGASAQQAPGPSAQQAPGPSAQQAPGGDAAVLGEPAPAPDGQPGGASAVPPPPPPNGYGQPAQPVYGEPGYVQPVEEAPPAVESMRHDDSNADHIVLGSTAFTAPKGSVYFSDYDIFFIQGGVAITDNFQLTLTSWLPIVPEQPFFLDISGKFAFLQTPRFHMAALASVLGITGAGIGDVPVVGRLGVVATACITENCYVSASASALFWFTENISSVVPATLNLGITARLVGIFSLIAEVNGLAAVGSASVSGALFDTGVLIGYGIRLSNQNFGFDLSFVKPILRDAEFPLVLGAPWLAFTYRSDALF